MKLWDKGTKATDIVDAFTVGNDRILDQRLAKYDVTGSMAHARMLAEAGIIDKDECQTLIKALESILADIEKGSFIIPDGFEDIHSYIEYLLTEQHGELGKKIHTGRSRNDQVLVDLHLYLKDELKSIRANVIGLANSLLGLAEEHKDKLMPGYTHMQIAMPSSFGLWFSAYAETLADDLFALDACSKMADQNPLGSAAGYGSSFPLNRQHTTDGLGFSTMKYNSVAAQLSRGKLERAAAHGLSSVAYTLAKFSMDVVLYMGQNFGFITFPDELTTGSSIMPHKKNPDVFELIRAKCNKIQSLVVEFAYVTNNLPTGYHRDFQLLKESLFAGIDELNACLDMSKYMLANIQVSSDILKDEKYNYLFSVERVNELVTEGKSFREAYVIVGQEIKDGSYKAPKEVNHTHEGSIGNLCLDEIRAKLK